MFKVSTSQARVSVSQSRMPLSITIKKSLRHTLCAAMAVAALGGVHAAAMAGQGYNNHGWKNDLKFDLQRSAGAAKAGCLAQAKGQVRVRSQGTVEIMDVRIEGLPPHTEFDLFVTQVPDPLFGLSWYQGDMETDEHGKAYGRFVGRFSEETFIVAPGAAVAPKVHDKDEVTNPPTGPVHTAHLGLWFNSPDDAAKAGCPAVVTPFNGEHNAGIQILNTAQYPADKGPLLQIKSGATGSGAAPAY